VDVRVVCATNQKISDLIEQGGFREDLYYRVSEITVNIPPLREREGGRLILARKLLEKYARQHKRPLRGFSQDAKEAIQSHNWPGNVRELENKIKSAVIMAEGKQVTAADMGLGDQAGIRHTLNLREVRQEAETKAIRLALIQTYGNISRSAELLGITRPTLYDLLDKYGLSADGFARKKRG
jgi:two-component system NtrC family response regulator